jgi:Ca-activated chloride channel homolog
MNYALLILLLTFTDPLQIAKVNGLKKEAEKAYQSGNYQLAASKYSMLADTLAVDEAEVRLNLAHSQYKIGDTASAKLNYARVSLSPDKKLKSIASQQLGVLAKDSKKLEESLEYLKSAIKADPTNAGAKYDYEVVKKLLEKQKQEQRDNDNIEPSEYAKKIKAQADNLRKSGQFDKALQIMNEGLQKDNTVRAFNEFMQRLQKVVGQ